MTDPARHLQLLVNEETGEIREPTPLEVELEMVKRELSGYRLRLAAKEKELRDLQAVDPRADEIQQVGDFHGRRVVEEGWWTRKPAFRAGTKPWGAVSARLKEEEYDTAYLECAIEGALLQPKREVKREWLTLDAICSAHMVERHFERYMDPRQDRVKALRALPEALQQDADLAYMAERCSWCGHTRFEHSVLRWPSSPMDGWSPCMAEGCDSCCDFDQLRDELAWFEAGLARMKAS